jgi:hypothetical protein
MKNSVFWDVAPCRSRVSSHLLMLVPHSQIFLPWRWRRYVPPKRLFTPDLHGATSQKTASFIMWAVLVPYHCKIFTQFMSHGTNFNMVYSLYCIVLYLFLPILRHFNYYAWRRGLQFKQFLKHLKYFFFVSGMFNQPSGEYPRLGISVPNCKKTKAFYLSF